MDPDVPVRIGISAWPPGVNPCILHSAPAANCEPGIELDILLALLHVAGIYSFTLHTTEEKGCGAFGQDERGKITKISGLPHKFENKPNFLTLRMHYYYQEYAITYLPLKSFQMHFRNKSRKRK